MGGTSPWATTFPWADAALLAEGSQAGGRHPAGWPVRGPPLPMADIGKWVDFLAEIEGAPLRGWASGGAGQEAWRAADTKCYNMYTCCLGGLLGPCLAGGNREKGGMDTMAFARPRLRMRLALPGAVGLLTLFTLAASSALAAEVRVTYDFAAPVLTDDGQFTQITLDNTLSYGAPGEPILPRAGAQVLLPPGEVVTGVEVIPGERVTLPGAYRVAPGQPQYPLSDAGPHPVTEPDPIVYASTAPCPSTLHGDVHTGWFRGHAIADLVLHPVEYIPAAGQVSYVRSLEVVLHTEPSADAWEQAARMIRQDARTRERLARIVDNPQDVAAYDAVVRTPGTRTLNPEDAYTYLIITGDPWATGLATLVDFETQRGHKAGIFTRTWIAQNYTGGVDEQANIRNFVIDAYQTWDVDYVLIVGDARDTAGIPHRGLYSNTAYSTSDSDIPADLYYGCLDGNWNSDGDNRWGEPGEEDFYHEVGVGRACIDSAAELEHFLTKTFRYQDAPITNDCDEALMVGELLWSDGTYGDDYKEEIRLGSSMHGYTTVGFPPTMNVNTLYDRAGTWTKTQLINLMNAGLNTVNHLGHCNVTYAMRMDNPDIASFTNDGLNHINNFVYSQGCYCGSFDNRTESVGSYTDDCFAEQFTADDHGAAAVVMNARYGWGQHLSTNGSSQYFDRQFFDAIFGERIYPIADANDDSKMDNVWSIDFGANRYCYYELNVFGDPALELWTALPGHLTVAHPAVVFIGPQTIDVTVTSQLGAAVSGARVTVYTDDYAVYDTGLTGVTGHVTLQPGAEAPGTLYIKVTAHDFLVFDGAMSIIPPAGPYLVYGACEVLDASGNQNGLLDWSETPGLAITLENVGIENTTNVHAGLSSEDPYVTIVTPDRAFPDIPAGATGCCIEPYAIAVSGAVPDQHVIAFDVAAHASEGDWEGHFALVALAPVLAADGNVIDDSPPYGNGDGGADAGETIHLQVWLANTGHSAAHDLTAELSCLHPDVTITDPSGSCVLAEVGGRGLLGSFTISIAPTCPEPGVIDLAVNLAGPGGFVAEVTTQVDVGAWFDDAETDRGWTRGAPGDNATSGLWVRADPIGTFENGEPVQPEDDHTPAPGTICFVTANGTPGSASGEADVDGGQTTLLTPAFDLSDAQSATVSYWRWYTNDLGNNPGQDWWTVDATGDGQTWVHLEYTQESANEWTFHEFDLTQYISLGGAVQLRFIASDASPGSLVEAAVDDFTLNVVRAPVTGVTPVTECRSAGFVSWGPNPARSGATVVYQLGAPARVDLAVYDVSGRMVRRLVDGEVEAGTHPVAFDGRDLHGRALAGGIYFLRLETPEVLQVKQISLVR